MKAIRLALLATAMGLSASAALAAGYFTNGVPPAGGTQYPSTVPLTGAETLPADTNLPSGANPASEAISTNLLSQFTQGGPNPVNMLIGGDAGTNLFQRATTGASVTTAVTYGGPDRWAYWSGTGTAMTVSRDTTAGDLPVAYQAAFKMARTSGQTGVVQMCMAQEIATSVATMAQGQTVELDFHAFTGANWSAAAPGNMTAYVVTGTGTDEGMAKLAFGLNAGGGGSSGWTGQANATAAVTTLGAVSTAGRYVAVANIPAAATEIGVALCYTPVGTAGTNDYVAFAGIQLKRSTGLAAQVSATLGYNATAIQASSFQRRLPGDEQELQQQYYYQITEVTGPSAIAMCRSHSVTIADCFIQFPVTMRAIPTMTYAAGFATETTAAGGTLGNCSAIATSATVAALTAASSGILVQCTATTVPAAGSAGVLYNNGGTGSIKASAEL